MDRITQCLALPYVRKWKRFVYLLQKLVGAVNSFCVILLFINWQHCRVRDRRACWYQLESYDSGQVLVVRCC